MFNGVWGCSRILLCYIFLFMSVQMQTAEFIRGTCKSDPLMSVKDEDLRTILPTKLKTYSKALLDCRRDEIDMVFIL